MSDHQKDQIANKAQTVTEITEFPMTSCQCASPTKCPVCILSAGIIFRNFIDQVIETKLTHHKGANSE